ncbi:hypothetical protein LCGC14_1493160 [marine sediment metagenome]|uniref:Methyltransferase domain-containing protein n=1 Tax=marine sediment metagenome TaxID=412755 RepID=A0A0F9JS19_9ZZZZ
MIYSKDYIMSYLYTNKNDVYEKTISGWWKDSVFEIYQAINQIQREENIQGDLCEIGTWHGRSFLPLRNFASSNETCIGIDIFHKDYVKILLNNITNCFGNLDGCKIINSDSKTVSTDTFKNPIRIFYIDGGHSYIDALSDLNLAKSVLNKKGIMFLDDYKNPRYGPNVVGAIDTFLKINKGFKLAFSSTQRIFLCKKEMVNFYVSISNQLTDWKIGKDSVYRELINLEHPLGYNSWKVKRT